MSDETRLKVVLCWHMHQPEYRDLATGQYRQPWVYLHAIKDYVDMAAHLESVPSARAVVNFVPILLDQIDDYAVQIVRHLGTGTALRDPLLSALAGPLPPTGEVRQALVRACLRANRQRLIERFPAYLRLVEIAGRTDTGEGGGRDLNDTELWDLIVWYHLAWLGETVRRSDPVAQRLIEKAQSYTAEDRRALLEIIGQLIGNIIGRYRALAKEGRVELSVGPYAHPMLPLLLDFASAREAQPDMLLPITERYPGGEERARRQLQAGIDTFEHHFGFRPRGCWPSEGGVSESALAILDACGIQWAASGGNVLRRSLNASGLTPSEACRHRPFHLPRSRVACFFRDDGLSDLIGFTYSDWHADDAVANFIHHLENIAAACLGQPDTVVSIILDGENAWEYYPENGYHFLQALYHRLTEHPTLRLTTFSEYLDGPASFAPLSRLVAGSWVYGTFSTWIGDIDKNRAWEMLVAAKRAFDAAVSSRILSDEMRLAAEQQLAICEGSDWFWWFGDYNPSATVSDFDELYRLHLRNLYRLIGQPPPEPLLYALSYGHGAPVHGGVMRRGDGFSDS